MPVLNGKGQSCHKQFVLLRSTLTVNGPIVVDLNGKSHVVVAVKLRLIYGVFRAEGSGMGSQG